MPWTLDSASAATVDSIRVFWNLEGELSAPLPGFYRRFPSSSKEENVLLWRDNGRSIYGSRATYQCGGLHFRYGRYCAKNPFLSVWLSLPTCKYGHNAFPATAADLEKVVEELDVLFAKWGVNLKARNGQLSDLHLNRNRFSRHYLKSVMPVVRGLDSRYSRSKKDKNYPTGRTFGSQSLSFCFYEKLHELRKVTCTEDDDEKAISKTRRARNEKARRTLESIMYNAGCRTCWRTEARWGQAAVIRKQLGIGTLGELIDNYSRIGDWLDESLRQKVFNLKCPRTPAIQKKRDTKGGNRNSMLECGGDWAKSTSQRPCLELDEELRGALKIKCRRERVTQLQTLKTQWGKERFETLLKGSELSKDARRRLLIAIKKAAVGSVLPDGTPWFDAYENFKRAVLEPEREMPALAVEIVPTTPVVLVNRNRGTYWRKIVMRLPDAPYFRPITLHRNEPIYRQSSLEEGGTPPPQSPLAEEVRVIHAKASRHHPFRRSALLAAKRKCSATQDHIPLTKEDISRLTSWAQRRATIQNLREKARNSEVF